MFGLVYREYFRCTAIQVLRQLGVAACEYQSMWQLPAEPTKIFTLPAYGKNEARIDEMTTVLRLVLEYLGYT
jgi:hypothetical protein